MATIAVAWKLSPGALVAGRYRVDRKIGSGGMGEVWAGEHVAIGLRVALKTLLPAAALDPKLVARFRREARLLGRLRSDRVARVVDFVEDRAFGLVLVMDFIEGDPLGRVLAARRLGIEEAIDVGVDVVTALSDLHHAAVVHRDLKPDNIILEPPRGGRRRAVIVDLGVSRLLADAQGEDVTSITQVDTAVGTLSYMAPEQLLSSSTVTGAADVYAVGAILYRAVAGEQVFGEADDAIAARNKITGEAPPLSLARVDRVARGFAGVVARALQRAPEQRFASAEEMQAELVMLQDLARAMAFDLDAATEEAMPSIPPGPDEGSASAEPSGAKTLLMSRPPAALAAASPTSNVPVVYDEDTIDEATRIAPASVRLLNVSDNPLASTFPDTHPAAAAPPPPPRMPKLLTPVPQTPLPAERPRRPFDRTLESPSLPERAYSPRTMESAPPAPHPAPSEPPATSSGSVPPHTRPTVLSPEAPPPIAKAPDGRARSIPLRLALLGLIAALAAGAAVGLEARSVMERAPAAPAGR